MKYIHSLTEEFGAFKIVGFENKNDELVYYCRNVLGSIIKIKEHDLIKYPKKPLTCGFIYILKNKAFPNLFKIGMAKNVKSRVKELNRSTSIPLPFTIFYKRRVINARKAESYLHELFKDKRVNKKREFFKDVNLLEVNEALNSYEAKLG